ncbi:carboxypeptidase-like regulatory domain-containing protein [Micromonospora chokoriensis]
MTTRSTARWTRAAALITLTAGTIAVSAAPAAAAPETVRILSVSAENVKPDETVRVRYTVTNNGTKAEAAIVVVGGGLRCTSGCRVEPKLGPGRSQTFDTTLVAPDARPGEITGLNISIGVRLAGQNSYDHKMVYVHGPGAPAPGGDKPASGVKGVSGRVRDAGGKAISGVALTIQDSAGHEYRTTSSRTGQFSITASAAKTIEVGPITVRASKDGYATARTTVRGAAGDVATVGLTLTAVPAPTTASASPAEEAEPVAAADEGTAEAAPPSLKAVSDEGGSSVPFLLGGLLVAVGLGALALVVMRLRNTPGAVAETDVPSTPQPWAPAGGSMADAPTAVLRAVPEGGFPGSYGTPPQGGVDQNGYRG